LLSYAIEVKVADYKARPRRLRYMKMPNCQIYIYMCFMVQLLLFWARLFRF